MFLNPNPLKVVIYSVAERQQNMATLKVIIKKAAKTFETYPSTFTLALANLSINAISRPAFFRQPHQ